MRDETRRALTLAAEHLERHDDLPDAMGPAGRFLAYLTDGAADGLAGDRDLASLIGVAARLERLFELALPDAPGLFCFGAEVAPEVFGAVSAVRGSVSGVGETRLEAFRACVGEAVEYLSQFESVERARFQSSGHALGDAAAEGFWTDAESVALGFQPRQAESGDPIELGHEGTASAPEHVPALDLAAGRHGLLPAELCWRRRESDALPFVRGLGVAAGRGFGEACRHAMLEWIERDAVALWWRGGRRGRALPVETLCAPQVAGRIARWRGGSTARISWCLDLSGDLGVPVAAALSVDRQGKRFAYGFAARPTMAGAVLAAFTELAQVELADRVVDAKLAEADKKRLNDTDRLHLARRSLVKPDWEALQPAAAPTAAGRHESGNAGERPGDLGDIEPLSALTQRNFRVLAIDLTRVDPGISVVRVLVPGLQPDPAALVTPRLQRQRAQCPSTGFPGDRVRLY